MLEQPNIVIMVPAYNEEKTICKVIKQSKKYGKVIVVDDGSSDKTYSLAIKEGATVIRHIRNCGYHIALRSGFKEALNKNAEYIITIDADCQHNPVFIDVIIKKLHNGADLVIASRDKKNRFSEYIFCYLTKIILNISDPLCGMKGYRTDVYSSFEDKDTFNSIGTIYPILASVHGYKISEFEIKIQERYDKSRFGNLFKGNLIVFIALFKVTVVTFLSKLNK